MRRRLLIAQSPAIELPNGFTQLEYITLGVSSRLVRDGMVGVSDVVYLDYQFDTIPIWSGSGSVTGDDRFRIYKDSYRTLDVVRSVVGYYDSTWYDYSSLNAEGDDIAYNNITTDRLIVCLSNMELVVNSISQSSSELSSISFNSGYSSGEVQPSSVSCRIYGCNILDVSDGPNWRHYMIPCMNNSNGVEGLYDLVDGIFIPCLLDNSLSIDMDNSVITSTYPVSSDLTISVSRRTGGSTAEYVLMTGSNSIDIDSIYTKIVSITPSYDDVYNYVIL